MTTTVLEVLRRARELVANKWTKGGIGTPEKGVCAVGGIFWARDELEKSKDATADQAFAVEVQARNLLDKKVWEMYPNHPDGAIRGMVGFNDAHSTTKNDVLAIFDKVIGELEEKV